MWEWVAAQPGVSVPQSQAGSSMCEFAAGVCGRGWLSREECLCQRVRRGRRCASLRLGYVGVGGCTARSVCATESGRVVDVRVCGWGMWEGVAEQGGVSVPESEEGSAVCEFAAGVCGSGWLHSQECLCHRVRQGRRCASLRLGYVGVGG